MRILILVSGWLLALGFLVLENLAGEALVEAGEVASACPAIFEESSKTNPITADERHLLRLQVTSLESHVGQLRQELQQAEAENGRYRQGLEKAVAELNRLEQRAAASRPAVRRARPEAAERRKLGKKPRSRKPPNGALKSKANLQMLGDQVFVSGQLKNSRKDFLTGTVWIELLHDDRVIDSTSYLAELGPGERQEYSTRFLLYAFNSGTLSARARFEY